MNIGILVSTVTRTNEVEPGWENTRLRAGDIIGVTRWRTDNSDLMQGGVPVPPSMPDTAWVIVTDVPQEDARRLRDVLCAPGEQETEDGPVLSKRKWRIPPASLPTSVRNTLLSQRWINFTWEQVKQYVRRVRTNAAITDGDVT